MVEDVSFTLMVTFTQENGKTTRPMVSASTTTLTEPSTKVIGSKTSNMEMERKFGLMALVIKASTKKGKNMAKANLIGLMVQPIVVISLITIFMALEFIPGAMVVNSQVFGATIKCTELDSLLGLMVDAMKGSM